MLPVPGSAITSSDTHQKSFQWSPPKPTKTPWCYKYKKSEQNLALSWLDLLTYVKENSTWYMLIHCILFQIILIISILCFFASNYCFLSCWLTVLISPGRNLIWNNCVLLVALSTLRTQKSCTVFILAFKKGLWMLMCWWVSVCVQAVTSPKQQYRNYFGSH